MRVGFIGLGTMGSRMAANLLTAGHALVIHDLDPAAGQTLVDQGATWAVSPAALAGQVEVVFTSLPGPPQVEAVALSPNGIIGGALPGLAFFDLSTNSPTVMRRIHAELNPRGVHVFDAPVSGGPDGAAAGRLAIWVGGDPHAFEAFLPVLRSFADAPYLVGPIGAGSVAKLVHNASGYIIQTALAETFTLGVKAGVDPESLWQAVRMGALGRRRTFDTLSRNFLPGRFDPPDFALELARKDVALACELGREFDVPLRLTNLTLMEMTEAMNRGWARRDSRSTMILQEERAGVEVRITPERISEILDAGARKRAVEPEPGSDDSKSWFDRAVTRVRGKTRHTAPAPAADGRPAGTTATPTNPATTQPATTQPATSHPATSQPATAHPATAPPATAQPQATSQPATAQPQMTASAPAAGAPARPTEPREQVKPPSILDGESTLTDHRSPPTTATPTTVSGTGAAALEATKPPSLLDSTPLPPVNPLPVYPATGEYLKPPSILDQSGSELLGDGWRGPAAGGGKPPSLLDPGPDDPTADLHPPIQGPELFDGSRPTITGEIKPPSVIDQLLEELTVDDGTAGFDVVTVDDPVRPPPGDAAGAPTETTAAESLDLPAAAPSGQAGDPPGGGIPTVTLDPSSVGGASPGPPSIPFPSPPAGLTPSTGTGQSEGNGTSPDPAGVSGDSPAGTGEPSTHRPNDGPDDAATPAADPSSAPPAGSPDVVDQSGTSAQSAASVPPSAGAPRFPGVAPSVHPADNPADGSTGSGDPSGNGTHPPVLPAAGPYQQVATAHDPVVRPEIPAAAPADSGQTQASASPEGARGWWYGWTVVSAVFVILMITSGLGFYNVSVILKAAVDELDATVGAVSGGAAMFFGVSGITAFLLARRMEQVDLRWFYLAGGLIGAGALYSLRWVGNVLELYLFFAVFGVGFALCGLVPGITLVTRWFQARRSIAISIASTGLSLGGIVLIPISSNLIDTRQLAGAAPILSLIWLLGVIPIGLLLIRSFPSDKGLGPDGVPLALATANQPVAPTVLAGATFLAARRTRFFIMMCVAYALIFFSQVGALAHLFSIASERTDNATASIAMALLALTSVIGRLGGGVIALKVPTKLLSMALVLLQALALASISLSFTKVSILASAVFLGVSVGNLLMLQPLLLAEAFGVKEYSRIYSFNQLFSTVGVAGGPAVLGQVHDLASYEAAFVIAAIGSVAGFFAFLAAGPVERPLSLWEEAAPDQDPPAPDQPGPAVPAASPNLTAQTPGR